MLDNIRRFVINAFGVFFTLILVILVVYLYVLMARTTVWVNKTNSLVENATLYERVQPSDFKILVLGDSLAFGVGNSSKYKSLAGLLGEHFFEASISNKSTIGETTQDLANSIKNKIDQRYNLILIVIGGNDIVHFGIDLEASKQNLKTIYDIASESADQVITVTSSDFKNVTLVPSMFRYYFSSRSKVLRDFSLTLSKNYENLVYIDTFEHNAKLYKNLEASDHIHLNDEGTKRLFDAILKVQPKIITQSITR